MGALSIATDLGTWQPLEHAIEHTDYGEIVEQIMSSGAEVVFNTIVPPGLTPFMQQLHDAGFGERGGVASFRPESFRAKPAKLF